MRSRENVHGGVAAETASRGIGLEEPSVHRDLNASRISRESITLMQSSQDDIFAAFEADRWFERNRRALARIDPSKDFPLRLMELYGLRPRRVLEVGAANGYRLAFIHQNYGCKVVAVEPSLSAVRDGKVQFPEVAFVNALAHAIPLKESFDLIIVNNVFHWVDRAHLLRSVAEIDRLQEDGGFLIIGDFYPSTLVRIRYHHLTDRVVYTYKQNYAATFLASGLYHEVGLVTGDHSSKAMRGDVEEMGRLSAWLLRKMLKEHYVEVSSDR